MSGQQTEPGISEVVIQVLRWSREGKKPEAEAKDGFPVYAEDPFADVQRQLSQFLTEIPYDSYWLNNDPRLLSAGAALLELGAEEKARVVRGILVRVRFSEARKEGFVAELIRLMGAAGQKVSGWVGAFPAELVGKQQGRINPAQFHQLLSALLKSNPPLTPDDLAHLASIAAGLGSSAKYYFASGETVMRSIERYAIAGNLTPELRGELELWKKSLTQRGEPTGDSRKLLVRIKELLGEAEELNIVAGEAWSNAAIEDVKQKPRESYVGWTKLLRYCQDADGSKPSKKWMTGAAELVEKVGREEFKQQALRWFELVALPRPIHQEPRHPQYEPDPDWLLVDGNTALLKGMVWCFAGWKDVEVVRAVSQLAQVCFKKVRNLGARSPRVGNACFYSLSVTTTDEAAAELSRLNQMVKQPSARKLIGKSLDKAAELSGQTREDLEESTVPTYGLDVAGRLRETLGDFTAEFCITGPDAFELQWRKADGKLQKSVPAEVKEKNAAELKALKRTISDIEKMLPAQRQRIERLLMGQREWEFEKWRQRYLDHPLLAYLSRRLIWQFQEGDRSAAGIWHDGGIVDSGNNKLEWLSQKTRVRIWHPLGKEVQAVVGWRRWLEEHQVTQPFKQAHREIYVLTPAEETTVTYSNRFAAQIIRQHQFAALAKDRGWTYRLQGGFDSHNTPTITLPQWDSTVEFWVNSFENDEMSPTGIFMHVATDQVKFCDMTGMARPLTEVPPLLFSEMMRDVDLFVGVCSVGNDPQWRDRGEMGGFGAWQRMAFGDLSASAQTRKDVLERLLPRLKIAGKCSLTDKFLVVRGSLRTYKIHLGSSNILMEPNDQYLCIVPGRGQGTASPDKIFLPFEGDNTLAVILSKAFLLADDAKIKDQSIVNQIKAGM